MASRYEGEPRGPASDTSRTKEPTLVPLKGVILKSGGTLCIVLSERVVNSLESALPPRKKSGSRECFVDLRAALREDSYGNLELQPLNVSA